MQRRIFSLLFLIAGVLLSQSAQAQTPINTFPVDANGTSLTIVPGTYSVSGNNVVQVGGQLCIVAAQNAGTITGNRVTFVVLPSQGTQIMHAFGTGSSISMTNTLLDITNSSTQSFDNNRGAFANLGGTVTLTDCAITESGSASGCRSP